MSQRPDVVYQCLGTLLATEHAHVGAPLAQHAEQLVRRVQTNGENAAAHGDFFDYVIQVCTIVFARRCEDQFLVYPYSEVPVAWRRLYTHAALLRACAALLRAQAEPDLPRAFWREQIRALDMALIASDSTQDIHQKLVHDMLAALQDQHGPSSPCGQKRHLRDTDCRPTAHPPLHTAIPERSQPTEAEFERLAAEGASGTPFIVRGYARHWRALQPPTSPRWADAAYLAGRAGPGRVVPIETGARYTDRDWGQTVMPFDEFLDRIGWGEIEDVAGEKLYLAQHTLLTQFPWLAEDLEVPTYVRTTHATHRGAAPITSVWLGPYGTVSPPHTDAYYNCYVQVVGAKWVWLAPRDADRGGAMAAWRTDAAESYAGLMHNTSRRDVWATPTCVDGAMQAVLQPGDMLYLPPRWWHAMHSLSRSFSVSFWF